MTSAADICQVLQARSNALCVVLVGSDGAEIARAGEPERLSREALPLLLRALDLPSLPDAGACPERLQRVDARQVHASRVGDAVLLILFDEQTSLGLVRLRARKAAAELRQRLRGDGAAGPTR